MSELDHAAYCFVWAECALKDVFVGEFDADQCGFVYGLLGKELEF